MSKEQDFRSPDSRRRIILYLIEKFLTEKGFLDVALTLKKEAHLFDYEICDNIDLDTIFLEYVSFFQYKFGKYPKISKKLYKDKATKGGSKIKIKSHMRKKTLEDDEEQSCSLGSDFLNETLQIKPVFVGSVNHTVQVFTNEKPLDDINIPSDWKDLATIVTNNLIKNDLGCRWSEIVGNIDALNIIKESVVLPLQHPELFSGSFKPWKSVLLHGPPGGGKTMIARTLCSETLNCVSFFNISSSTITSKWRGESEKLIKVLFKVAKYYSPSIIFIDEVEGLISKRDVGCENDASFRSKNELLSLMDGLEHDADGIFILANSNMPWIIDDAFLRRFEKKIFIDLPNNNERIALLQKNLSDSEAWCTEQLENLANECEGFTGDEIRIACKEARMKKIRTAPENNYTGTKNVTIKYIDISRALMEIKPLARSNISKHREWNKKYGTTFLN